MASSVAASSSSASVGEGSGSVAVIPIVNKKGTKLSRHIDLYEELIPIVDGHDPDELEGVQPPDDWCEGAATAAVECGGGDFFRAKHWG